MSLDIKFTPDYFYTVNDYVLVYINGIYINAMLYHFFASIDTQSYQTFLDYKKASSKPRQDLTEIEKSILDRYTFRRIKILAKDMKDMVIKKVPGQPKPIKADPKRLDSNKYEEWIYGGINL